MSKRNIYIMYLIALLQGMVFYAPVATLYRQAQGVTIFQITVIESISLILCMVMELPWGILADKIGYKKTMLSCNILYFISKIVFWKADGFGLFLLERIMLSIVCAGLSGVDTSVLYLSCKEGESQKVFGVFEGLGTVGLLTTSFVYSFIIKDNYSLAGMLTVFSYGLAMLLTFGLVEVKREEKKQDSFGDFIGVCKEIGKNKKLFLFLIGIALFHETHQTITVFLSQLQYVRAGISHGMMGILYGCITIAALCGVMSDKITKRLGEKRMIRNCILTAMVSCIVLAGTKWKMTTILGILLLRISFSLFNPLQLELQNRQIKIENRATALSVHSVFMDSVGIGTNIIFGALAEYSLVVALVFGAVCCLASWILYEIWSAMRKSAEACIVSGE